MEPITFTVDEGIQLTTRVNPATGCHEVACDQCARIIVLTSHGSPQPLFQHRLSKKCTALRNAQDKARERSAIDAILVSHYLSHFLII
jgi:hypothetical protein